MENLPTFILEALSFLNSLDPRACVLEEDKQIIVTIKNKN